jgi:hypothetical protein
MQTRAARETTVCHYILGKGRTSGSPAYPIKLGLSRNYIAYTLRPPRITVN